MNIIPSSITPPEIYWNRRRFIQTLTGLTVAASLPVKASDLHVIAHRNYGLNRSEATLFDFATHYNNFYEFGPDKTTPSNLAALLVTRPWTVVVDGEVHKPMTFDIDVLQKISGLEDRIYRHRCVEGWSMTIPWIGYSLSKLLKKVRPTGNAKFVEFTSVYRPSQLPEQNTSILQWPYLEGLRIDEAMHPLTLLCFGMYGQTLPNQNGGPVRLVVPWKYGFKSAKSLVRIRLVEDQPIPTWQLKRPDAYGFYSNVNPSLSTPSGHPDEYHIGPQGELINQPTLLFNGYAKDVAHLYKGMDLGQFY